MHRKSSEEPQENPAKPTILEWQKQELARRKANLAQNPASGLTWDEVKRRVRRRFGR